MRERISRGNYVEDPFLCKPLHESIEASSKPEFKKLLGTLQEKVYKEDLIPDRKAQARLDILLNLYAERSERADNLPLIILKTKPDGSGSMLSVQPYRFQLADKNHLYYFDQQWPREKVPAYLRPEDVVEASDYQDDRVHVTQPFTKALNRVELVGGSAELFNYNTMRWEENEQGFFEGVASRNRRYNSSFR